MMLLTTCAACAKPIDHDASSRCVACETRYCSDRCQRYDRRRGGHGKICGAIASGGGAEQYHADKKYEEAVAVAVEACAADTNSNVPAGARVQSRNDAELPRGLCAGSLQ